MGKVIKVTNGTDTFDVNEDKLPLAVKDGFRPTERVIVANTKTGETYEVNPEKFHLALEDGFSFKDIVKKKVGGSPLSALAGIVGKAGTSEAPLPSATPSQKDQLISYMQGLKEPKQTQTIDAGITQVRRDKPYNELKIDKEAKKEILDVMYDEGEDWKDPLKGVYKKVAVKTVIPTGKDLLVQNRAERVIENNLFPDGFEASRLLQESHFKDEPATNITARRIKEKADAYQKATQPYRSLQFMYGDRPTDNPMDDYRAKEMFYDAAMKAYAEKNPNFKAQVEVSGMPTIEQSAKRGQVIEAAINDPDFIAYVTKENPNMIPLVQKVSQDLYRDNKEYGITQIANKVSRRMQEEGYNNIDPLFNYAGETAKNVADLTAQQTLTPEEYKIYQENNVFEKLDMPSLAEGFASSAKGIIGGIGNTITEPFSSVSESVRRNWEKEASVVSADPKGFSKFLRDSGHALGTVATIGATGNVIGGVSMLNPQNAGAVATVLGFGGDQLEIARAKYPNDPVKAVTSALVNTGLYAALSYKLFPASKVQQAFTKVEPELSKVVENLTNGKITREAARQKVNTATKQALDYLTTGLAKNAKVSAELTGITIVNRALDKIMGMDDKTFEQYHPEDEVSDTFKSMFLSNAIVSGLATRGEIKGKNEAAKNSIYEAALYPQRYRGVIENMNEKPEVLKQILDNLKFIETTKKELDARGLTENQKKEYLYNSLAAKVLNESRPASPDAVLTRLHTDRIKNLEEINQGILEGKEPEEIVTTEQQELADEKQKEDATRNKLIEKGQTAVQKLLEEKDKDDKNVLKGIYRDIAKSDPIGFLQDIADQALGMERVEGERVKSKSAVPDIEEQLIKQYGADVVNAAKELFPIEVEAKLPDQSREIDMGSEAFDKDVDLGGGIKNKVVDKESSILPISEIDNLRSQRQTDLATGNAISLEKDLSQNGIKEPLVITYYPNEGKAVLTDGHNRLDVAKDMGAEKLPIRIVERYTDAPNNAKDWTPPKKPEQSVKESWGGKWEAKGKKEIKPLEEMSGEQLADLQLKAKETQRNALIDKMGREWYEKYQMAGAEEKAKMEDALTPEQRKVFNAEDIAASENPELIKEIRQAVSSVESMDDVNGVAKVASNAVIDLANGRNEEKARAVLNAASRRTGEEGFSATELKDAVTKELIGKLGEKEAKALLDEYFGQKETPVKESGGEVIEQKKYVAKSGGSPEVRTYNVDTAMSLLKDLGVDASFSGYSDSNGVSVYFVDKNGKKIRVSDHGVSNKDRIANEVLLTFDTKTFGIGGKEGFKSYVEQNKKTVERLLQNEPTKEIPEGTQPKSSEEVIGVKETVNKEGGGAIPPEPPKAAPGEPSESRRLNDKGILNRLYEAKNVPEAAKRGFEKVGLKYEVQSQTEAQELAKGIVDEFGVDEAVTLAEANRFKGGVRSAVFAESLTRLSEQESAATTPEGKLEAAKKFAEIATRYDEFSREQGRDISQIDYFYKKSPLGVVISENAKRKGEFDTWAKSKNKNWQEFFDEMMKEPEFEAIVKQKIKDELKKERAENRAKRVEKVKSVFNKAREQFKGGATYSTIIPPKVITAAIDVMEGLYMAGEKVVEVVQKGIDYVNEQMGNAPWDREKFRKEWEAKLNEQEPKGKKELTDEELKLKVLDKFRKKLSGLTEKQKEQVIRKAHRKLIENGALDFEDFKQIIGQVTGRGELTPEQAEQMKKLVKSVNGVEDAAKKVREERTPESFVQFRKAEIEAGRASRELNELFYNKTDIVKRIVSVMQLNTLGIPSLLNNPVYNFWNQLLMRFPVGLVNDIIDRGLSAAAKAAGKNYDREYNVLETQAKFFETLGFGAKEAISQLRTGLNRQDYLQKEVYGQQIRPMRALKELIAYQKGKKSLTKAQVLDKAIQATAGVPAEIIARFLNIGDKPQRFAAEGAQGSAFAKTLGLKGIDEKIFIEFPREEAYRAYKAQGFSDEVAAQKADYIKEAIIQEGKRSTFQQDNLLNDALTRAFGIFGGKDSGWANLAKTLTVSPYIKIPSNAFWSLYNLLNPEIAIIQASAHGANSKRLSGKGEVVRSKLQAREARYWMAHAIVGMGMRAAVIALVKAGVFTPGSDGDDSKKERDAVSYWDKPGTTEINGIKISNRWFGQLGAMGNAIAKKYMDATPEQREKQDDFWNTILGGMEVDGLKELQNGIFANSSALFDAISNRTGDRYFSNILNMMANIVQPAAIAQINRAALDEVPSSRGDSFLDKLNQNFAQRSSLYRRLFDVKIDKKRDVWGQTIPRGGNVLSRMFGISKADPQIFARPIYDDYLETSDSGFLPPAVLPIVNKQKLNKEQYDRLQQYVGSERKKLVEPYVNDMAMIPGFDFYSKIKDKEVKKAALEVLYEKGKEAGLEKFYSDYPEFRPKDKEGEEADKAENIKEMKQELKDF